MFQERETLEGHLERLGELGLTPSQARVYIVLLSLGSANARSVCALTKLSREETYRALRSLQSLSLVEVIIDNPQRFQAVGPEICIDILLSHLELRLEKIRDKARELVVWLSKFDRVQNYDPKETPSRTLFKLEGGAQVFEQMSKLIFRSNHEISHVISGAGVCQNYALGILDLESEASSKGIRVRVVTEVNENNLEIIEQYSKCFEIRDSDNMHSALRFVIVDNSELILFTTSPTHHVKDVSALWTNNSELIEGFKLDFNRIWDSSKKSLTNADRVSDMITHHSDLSLSSTSNLSK